MTMHKKQCQKYVKMLYLDYIKIAQKIAQMASPWASSGLWAANSAPAGQPIGGAACGALCSKTTTTRGPGTPKLASLATSRKSMKVTNKTPNGQNQL